MREREQNIHVGGGPVRLVYSKGFSTKSEAMKAEYAFKQWDRKKKLNYLIKEGSYVATEKL